MPVVYKSPIPLSPETERALIVFNVNTLRTEIIRDLSMHPDGETTGDIARRLDVDYRQVHKHVAALVAEGLVSTERSGRSVLYRIQPEVLSEQLRVFSRFLSGE